MNNENEEDDHEIEYTIEVDDIRMLPFILQYIESALSCQRLTDQIEQVDDELNNIEAQKLVDEVKEELWKYE